MPAIQTLVLDFICKCGWKKTQAFAYRIYSHFTQQCIGCLCLVAYQALVSIDLAVSISMKFSQNPKQHYAKTQCNVQKFYGCPLMMVRVTLHRFSLIQTKVMQYDKQVSMHFRLQFLNATFCSKYIQQFYSRIKINIQICT